MFLDTTGNRTVAILRNYLLPPALWDFKRQPDWLKRWYLGCVRRIDSFGVYPYTHRHHSLLPGNGQTDRIANILSVPAGERMTERGVGVAVTAPDSNGALAAIEYLEKQGFPATWMTSGSASGGDRLSVFAAAASLTQHIMLGTAITQTFPRHPIAVAQQVLVLAQLAPGRFRLGLGTSGRGGMKQTYGVDLGAPLAHLREYIRIEKVLLQQGALHP